MALIKCPECKKQISETVGNCPHCGYRFSSGEIEKLKAKTKSNTIAGFFILAIVLFFSFKLCSISSDSEYKAPWDQEDHSLNAWVNTQAYVENNLKSPSTAKFPSGYSNYVYRNGTTYTINSYVDSQNSFGAMIRTKFKAIVQEESENKWVMVSFQIVE